MAVTVSHPFWPIKAADTLNMDNSVQYASQTTYLHDQKSLTLRWRSFPAWGCYHIAFSFAYKRGRYVSYGQQRAHRLPINSLTNPKVVEAPLSLIFRMMLLLCRCLFCLLRLAIHWLWITVSKSLPNWVANKSKNSWRSSDAHHNYVLKLVVWCNGTAARDVSRAG